jgi:uncharacterized membrane protein YdjX (TVP38/TMEM64 family)
LFAALALVAVVVLAWVFGRSSVEAAGDWLRGRGKVWGLAILALAYTPAALLLFPTYLLTLGAGAIFGVPEATIAISLGSTFAAGVVFLVGRFLARRWVEAKLANSPRFRALDRAVADKGFRIVLLTRLSPAFPYTLLNYAYGLTKIRFRDYLLASWIGMLPGTLMYVSLGRGARGIADLTSVLFTGRASAADLEQALLLLVGLLATVAVTILVTRLARKSLRTALDEQPG